MFTKTPVELLLKDFSNLLNKCQSVFDLVISRRYNVNLAILTTAEAYAIAEKAYVRCDQNVQLQTKEVEAFVNAFDDFYFELKQVLFHDDDDIPSFKKRLTTMQEQYELLTQSFNLL
ncbi:hypothetical protein JZO76_00840 [Enterococcus sp. MJM12]|uniref:Uncharacterized protein n=1 Tax=Candidatus Enterococcus myersii TaxID=2815322 RepID=A0ABS3H3P6_9ENTE|nr:MULTISPECIES: hypothetical protein [Enterococcus]MBO0448075.1 hypothetical protein [Enterococcus sp. MJM12]MCD1024754.1 hypothetical protein [Enterococcus sp. SMC-9]MDT2740227.1 hypothetical protein [Enterococcus canintestini]WHA08871.1 hypothetical protein P3T75_11270 [Enterococcus montenegrensis]